MAENQFNNSVKSLLEGLDGFISSKTVIGDPVTVNDSVILPLMEVQLGVGAGAYGGKSKGTGGGMGAKMSPSAVLVIQNGAVKLVNIKNQDAVTKVLDMVPDVIDKIKGKKVKADAEVDEKIEEMSKKED